MRAKLTKTLLLLFIPSLLLTAAGCARQDDGSSGNSSPGSGSQSAATASITASEQGYPLTITDFYKAETVIETPPQRVAVLSGTPLNIWYDLGGKTVATADITDNLKLLPQYREELLQLPTVGPVYGINMESVIAHEPDLIIAQIGTQINESNRFREMGYPVISTYVRSFDDVIDTYRAFGAILQQQTLAEQKISQLTEERNQLLAQSPRTGESVVILYLTSRSLAVKLDNSIAGDVAGSLGLINIASNLPPDTIGSENAPLDIEYIVAQNPDYVLVTSMIEDNETAIATMNEEFSGNPAWRGVEAVWNGRVVYLPQEYFLYNAGPFYVEGVEYMARSIYPQIYGEVEGWYGD